MGLLSRTENATARKPDLENTKSIADTPELDPAEKPAPDEKTPVAAGEGYHSLDNMGKALSERINRLPQRRSTPYTSLSLLKAYGAFQSGACLILKNGIYTSYTSVGFGIEKISIPRDKIWPQENVSVPYYKLDPDEKDTLKNAEKKFEYWVFPLTTGAKDTPAADPWEEIMILGVSDSAGIKSAFNPQSISAIIPEIADKLMIRMEHDALPEEAAETRMEELQPKEFTGPSAETSPVEEKADSAGTTDEGKSTSPVENENPDTSANSDESEILNEFTVVEVIDSKENNYFYDKIFQFCQTYQDINCILLENPDAANNEEKDLFFKKTEKMIGTAGATILIPLGHPLILLPKTLDRELIAHRISKSLKTKILVSFLANDPRTIVSRIQALA